MIGELSPDVLAVQEVGDSEALDDLAGRLDGAFVLAIPGPRVRRTAGLGGRGASGRAWLPILALAGRLVYAAILIRPCPWSRTTGWTQIHPACGAPWGSNAHHRPPVRSDRPSATAGSPRATRDRCALPARTTASCGGGAHGWQAVSEPARTRDRHGGGQRLRRSSGLCPSASDAPATSRPMP